MCSTTLLLCPDFHVNCKEVSFYNNIYSLKIIIKQRKNFIGFVCPWLNWQEHCPGYVKTMIRVQPDCIKFFHVLGRSLY